MRARYDLSRLRDRVCAIEDELDDLGISTVGGLPDGEIRKMAAEASVHLQPLKTEIEERIEGLGDYIPVSADA